MSAQAATTEDGTLTGLLAAFAAGGLVISALIPASAADDGPILCPFRLMTGLPCPGCGLTRSWIALVHGDISGSLAAHPFGGAFMFLGVALILAVGVALIRRRPLPAATRVVGRVAPASLFVGTVVFGFGRLALLAL